MRAHDAAIDELRDRLTRGGVYFTEEETVKIERRKALTQTQLDLRNSPERNRKWCRLVGFDGDRLEAVMEELMRA